MKRLLLLFMLAPTLCLGQFSMRNHGVSLGLMFLSGASDGVRDASMFHMWGKGQFWDGNESWKNKYADYPNDMSPAYWGSTNVLVWTTDAPHLFNMFSNQLTSFSVATYPGNSRKFKHILLDAVIYNVTRQAGHSLMYNVILK